MVETMKINNGWLDLDNFCIPIEHQPSPYCDDREDSDISLLVIHNISLPPGQFGGPYITDLFMGRLNPAEHDYFVDIYQLKVSAHVLVRRDGSVIQYVPFHKRAWHAGVSCFQGREKCNDFSIGIELEGTDTAPYTDAQYASLATITQAIQAHYPDITEQRITGHCDIAPGRKTDPGQSFDWHCFRRTLSAKHT
ncbi:1,6-anhydro-N-acetylmuramyl-L-alanine amidase AmpD [Thalassotalea ponticola]|uniref:1,6-anhydro-N-acetylmuramyl-L-alanine amidase AmpD n=1 Tax=Thalassotalea ponticola TaxID=1523392 RepID=UPI0035287A76